MLSRIVDGWTRNLVTRLGRARDYVYAGNVTTFARSCIRRFMMHLLEANTRLLQRSSEARHGQLGENDTLAALGIGRTCPVGTRMSLLDVFPLFSTVGPAEFISDLGTAVWVAYQQQPAYMWDTSSLTFAQLRANLFID